MELCGEIVDDSDPDLDLPQIEHAMQTAEAIRAAYPDKDWLHFAAFIHDLGKVLAHPRFGSAPQWAVVGDTFPVGVRFDESIVYHSAFAANPDSADPRYNTEFGIYSRGCGLDSVHMSWGHDEYMYQVLVNSGCTLPLEALYIVRFHSFYALHREDRYGRLLDERDRAALPWIKEFNKYDLYSKSSERLYTPELHAYYDALADKFLPNKHLQW